MSEVLGDAEPSRDGGDFDSVDDREYDDVFDDDPGAVRGALASLLTPGARAIAALVIGSANLLLPLSSYVLATAVTASHVTDQLYGSRVLAIVQLVTALITLSLAAFAAAGAERLDDAHRRMPQIIAGATILISVFAILEAGTGLIVLANTHVPDFG